MIERIQETLHEVIWHSKAAIILWLEAIKLKLAIALSDIKQKARNKRYFVVLATVGYDKKGRPVNKLRSINNSEFKHLKRIGWLPKKMSYLELSEKCFYSTSLSRNNKQTREERDKAMKRYMRYQKIINSL